MKIRISSIVVGERQRKDIGDLGPLEDSIRELGLLQPIVVDSKANLIAGFRRLQACKNLGWKTIDVHAVDLEDPLQGEFHETAVRKPFTPSEIVAIYQAMKRGRGRPKKGEICTITRASIARYCGISERTLKKMVSVVESENDELIALMDKRGKVDKAYNKLQRSRIGEDLPKVRSADIKCGDAAHLLPKMRANSFDAVITDPPWNLDISYNGTVEEFKEDYGAWIRPIYQQMLRLLKPDGFLAIWQPQQHLPFLWDWFGDFHMFAACSGVVERLGGRPIIASWTPVVLQWKGKKKVPKTQKSNIDYFVSKNTMDKFAQMHPCPRPLDVVEAIIENFTMPGSRVLDPFGGSGSTAVACKKLGRKCVCIEKDEGYCKLIQKRLDALGEEEI